MHQNYSQRLEMQIPQENMYTGLENVAEIDELEKLSKNYTLRKTNELKEYMEEHNQLIPYINSITPIIKEYFPDIELPRIIECGDSQTNRGKPVI